MKDDDSLLRVAKNHTLHLENLLEERGGFWVVEYENGFIDFMNSMPVSDQGYRSTHYCDDVIKAQDKWLAA